MRRVVAGLVLINVGYLVMLAAKPGGADLVMRISDITTAGAAAAACVACVLAGRRCVSSMRTFWWVLAAALGAWTCGEATWSWYEVVLRVQVPTPSWADVGYLAAPMLVVAAFACHPATRSRERWRAISILDAVAVASALLFVAWILVLGPLWSHSGGLSVGALVAVAYPFSDVMILVLVVLALRSLPPGRRAVIALLLGGLVCMAVSDTVYTYLTQIHRYASGDLIDAGWFAAYLAIAGGAFLSQPSVDTGDTGDMGDTGGSQAVAAQLTSVLVPYAPILVALVAIPVDLSRDGHLGRVEWGIAICLTAVVLLRQLLHLLQRKSSSETHLHEKASHASLPTPALQRRSTDPAFAAPSGSRGELATLTLQMMAAARPTAQERVHRVTASMMMGLTSVAGALALWDLFLLVRSSAR